MKTKEQIVQSIFEVLSVQIRHPYLSGFQSDARLREDLALDSSTVLQMLVHLEVDRGLRIPEEAMMGEDFDTVRRVAALLYDAQERPNLDKLLEYEEDIKLHCFVSCLSEIVKRCGLDQRPIYFGVWDSEVVVTDQFVISYHSETINHQVFVDWYERLYGIKMHAWYDPQLSKEENATLLTSLVENRTPDQHIMVMLDMFLLPERVNEFNKDPFPHYLMLIPTLDPEEWMICDPDYRWEGVTKRSRILDAMRRPSVAGGFVFSDKSVRAPDPKAIKAHFDACLHLNRNPMTEAIRQIVAAHVSGRDKNGGVLPIDGLATALDEIPILSIRKYAYEHGFAFFWRELELPEKEFDDLCDRIDELAKAYKLVHFLAKKLAATNQAETAEKIFAVLDEQDQREWQIKKRMHDAYEQWCDGVFAQKRLLLASGGSL